MDGINSSSSRFGFFKIGVLPLLLLSFAPPTVVYAQTKVEYIHTDALGSPVAVTDASGNVIEREVYEPYGSPITRPGSDQPGFTGHVMDSLTNLTYMQQRYYDPQIGRFLSVDPVTAYSNPVGAFNRYRYAANNPYLFTDPDGRSESNWFNPKDGLYLSNVKFYANGAHTISSHANPYYLVVSDSRAPDGTVRFGGEAAVSRAQSLDGLKSGETIIFAACEVGKGAGIEAQRASDANKSIVVAPDGYVFSPSTNKGYSGNGLIVMTVNSHVNNRGEPGVFKIFVPGGAGPVPGVSISRMSYDPGSGEFSAILSVSNGNSSTTEKIDSIDRIGDLIQ